MPKRAARSSSAMRILSMVINIGQLDRERGSLARATVALDQAAQGADLPGNCMEAKAVAGLLGREKRLKKAFADFFGHSGPIVAHLRAYEAVHPPAVDGDTATRTGGLQGIGQKIEEY